MPQDFTYRLFFGDDSLAEDQTEACLAMLNPPRSRTRIAELGLCAV